MRAALPCAGPSESLKPREVACQAAHARPQRCRTTASSGGSSSSGGGGGAPALRRRDVRARGLLDLYRQQQQQQQQKQPQKPKEPEVPVVESLLMEEGVHFTEDDTPCPTDCVIEVFTEAELEGVFSSALPDALVVVDFFKTDCPACKVMAPGFHRMCRSASEHAQHIIFVKHNIYEYEDDDGDGELTPLARRFKIKTVPQFAFFKSNGAELVESFATRDKTRLTEAVDKHAPVAVGRWDDGDA
ncbi:thioredoxin-like chloroplastic [Raphidocelis subcapitata]|uniref:Thioredoxin-like chloroplastic n=1 Tax=Raphidocelis subcapitata TaxID=307507 RepID=A0A2V0PCN3_9CHLO|nr:thioredoxin-like chloroplastic [Raphidocelis subcapitata]|eukprot:GBF94865.1 thioredoxin-like chloroplastic [Raphidocelis subcapitata]